MSLCHECIESIICCPDLFLNIASLFQRVKIFDPSLSAWLCNCNERVCSSIIRSSKYYRHFISPSPSAIIYLSWLHTFLRNKWTFHNNTSDWRLNTRGRLFCWQLTFLSWFLVGIFVSIYFSNSSSNHSLELGSSGSWKMVLNLTITGTEVLILSNYL